jgi:hypothetical protein
MLGPWDLKKVLGSNFNLHGVLSEVSLVLGVPIFSSKDFEVGCAEKGFWFQFRFPRINLSFGSNRRLVTGLDFFHV